MMECIQISQPNYHPTVWRQIDKPRHSDTFGVIYLDYDQRWENGQYHVSRPTRNNAPPNIRGLPATARFMVDKTVDLTQDIQLWMHGLCCERSLHLTDAQQKAAWRSMMDDGRWITNYAGSRTRTDWVNMTNLNAENMRLQPMATGGAVLRITGERIMLGADCWEFETINSLGSYRNFHPSTHPWLFFQPTNSVRENGREDISEPFPQYDSRSIIPIFAAGADRQYIAKWRVRLLADDEPFPGPFVF